MNRIFDLILVLIVVVNIRRGWRTGFLFSLILLIGWGVAAFFIAEFSFEWANDVYFTYIEPAVVDAVDKSIPADAVAAMNSAAATVESVQALLDRLGGMLGGQIAEIGDMSQIEALLSRDGTSLAQAVTQTILQPILLSALRSAISVLILIVTVNLFRIPARLTARRRRGVLGKANHILGAALGAAEGALSGYLYALVLSLLAELLTVSWLTPEILRNTVLVSKLIY